MELKDQYNVGDMRLHTVLLFNEEAVRACGPICQDIYGTYPGVPPAALPGGGARRSPRWLLQRFAERGNGVYQEFNNAAASATSAWARWTTRRWPRRNVMKTLMVQPLSVRARATTAARWTATATALPDDAGQHLHPRHQPLRRRTATATASTTASRCCASDQGFSAGNDKDARGCDPASPLTLGLHLPRHRRRRAVAVRRGVPEDARRAGRTATATACPDGLEVRYGLDPLEPRRARPWTPTATASRTLAEMRAGSEPDPPRPRPSSSAYGYQYETTAEVQRRRQRLLRLHRLQPAAGDAARPRRACSQGYNLFKVYFAEAPESGVATDYGVWRTACAWAQYDPPGVREPAGPGADAATNGDFLQPPDLRSPRRDYLTRCVGTPP